MNTSIRLTLMALFISLVSFSYAQVRISPKVGFNFSALDTRLQDITAEARSGWNAGVDLRLGSGFIFLNPGLHYYSFTAELMENVDGPGDVNLSEETTIQSLRAPLNLGIRLLGNNNVLNVYGRGGITPAYVLGVKERPDFAFDADLLNRFTWGANVGVGVDLLFLTAEINYEIGLNDFFKDAAGENNILTLSAGLKF